VAHLLTVQVRSDLDRLLQFDAGLGMARLAWLIKPAVEATASAVKTSIEKLEFLRAIDAHLLDLSMLPAERRRFLATVGRRSTVQALERREKRRYPILLALVAQSAVDQLDEVVSLFDQAVSARESRAKTKTDEALAERAKTGEVRQLLLRVILPALADPAIPDEQVGGLLREQIGMQRLREAAAGGWKPLPRDHGRLSAMRSSYSYLRQFAPHVLSVIDFEGGPGTAELMEAVTILKELNRTGGRRVPEGAPEAFAPARFAIAMATNLGLARMSEACGVPYDVLAWTAEWYVREETLREANTCIVNHHHSLELAGVFGGGTMSSSDGQRFPVRGKSLTGREMTVFGGQVLSTYTHVSDQHSTFGTKVIVATTREAQYVLDDFLGNATDLPVYEHATDTHGVDPHQLRPVRPGGEGAVAARPRPGEDNDDPGRHPGRDRHAVPARRAATVRPVEREPGRSLLAGPAADGRVAEVRAGDRVPARREVVGRLTPEHPGRGVEGVGDAAPDDPRRPVPVGSGVPAEDRPAAEQGRVAARAAP